MKKRVKTRKKSGRNKSSKTHYFWAILRITIGLIFLWAFFDKLIGLGFTTCLNDELGLQVMCDSAWVNGGSPTYGFLTYAVKGPFASFFGGLAGQMWVDWLFMIGLLGIGLGLTLGVLVRLSGILGALMMILMWLAVFPPEHNPLIDDHIIYAIVLLGFAFIHTCKYIGLGWWWSRLPLVKKYRILE